MAGGIELPNWVHVALSCIAHFLFLAPAIYIVALAAGQQYALFNWHPACLSLGCGFLMTEAVFGISGDALLFSRVSRANRIRIHWILHVCGLALLVIGFGAVVANKSNNNFDHFTSDHGRLGLSSFIFSLVVALGGLLLIYSGILAGRVSIATMKLIHGCLGIVTMILLLSTLITGVYRGWWPGGTLGRGLTVGAYVLGGILLLLKPLQTSVLRIIGVFS